MQIETLPLQEADTAKITADKVWQAFKGFEVSAQEGFSKEEDRLKAYLKFIGTTATFFNDPEVKKTNSPHLKALVNALFYHHQDHAQQPAGFFLESAKRLHQEVLDEGLVQPLYSRFHHELDFIGKLLNQELLTTAQATKNEQEDRQTLENLAAQHIDNLPAIDSVITTTQQRQNDIKQTAIDQLATEENFRQDIERKDVYLAALRQLQGGQATAEAIRQNLTGFKDFLGESTFDDLYLHASLGQNQYVANMLGELLKTGENPDFIWNKWSNEGVVPTSLLDSFEQILTLAELAEISHTLADMSKEVKAKYYLPYLEKGISASLLLEMVQSRYELPDDLIAKEVATFLDFGKSYAEKTTKEHKPWSTKRKIATALIAATIVATPFVYQMLKDRSAPSVIEQVLEGIPEEELNKLQKLNEGQTAPPPTEAAYAVSSDFIKPVNDSPEGLISKQKSLVWNLEGTDLWGFYRTGSSSSFDPYEKGWRINRQYVPNSQAGFSSRRDITLSTQAKIGSRIMELPAKENYLVTLNGIRLQGVSTGYAIFQATDGTYFLSFNEADLDKTITLSYGLGKTDRSVIPQPSNKELPQMQQKYIEIEDLPPGQLKTFMQQLKTTEEHSLGVKAKLIEKYIQDNFLYSLNKRWSDQYHKQEDTRQFLRKIAEIKRTDCDVANTFLVMMLRSLNIPARMAFGSAHTGGLFNPNPKIITQAENHGWVESYIGGQWVTLDATPKEMDEYTKNALGGKISPQQISPQQLEQIRERDEFIQQVASLGTWLEEEAFIKTLLQITGLNIAALAISILLKRRSNRLAQKLQTELETRTKRYLGRNYPELGYSFTKKEWQKINQARTYGTNPFAAIPPFGIVDLALNLERGWKINRLPYQQETTNITQTTQPNTLEYLTKILGYNEKEIRRRLYAESYKETISHITSEIKNLSYAFWYDGDIIPHSFSAHISKSVQAITEPENAQGWENKKRVTTDKLYQHYLTVRAQAEKRRRREAQRYNEDPNIMPRLSKEEFGIKMDDLYRLKLVQWTISREYVKALKSLGNNT